MGGIVSKKNKEKKKQQQQEGQQQAEAQSPQPVEPTAPTPTPRSEEQPPAHLAEPEAADAADDASSSDSSSDSSSASSSSFAAPPADVQPPADPHDSHASSAAPSRSHSPSPIPAAADSLESPPLWPSALRVVITPCESPTNIAVEPFEAKAHEEEPPAEVRFEADADGESPVAASSAGAHSRAPSQVEEQKGSEEAQSVPMSITVTDSDAAAAVVQQGPDEPAVAVSAASSSSSDAESDAEDDVLPPPNLPPTAEVAAAESDPVRVFHPHPPSAEQNGRPWSATVPPRQPARATHVRSASAARRPQRPTRPTHPTYRSVHVQPASSADTSSSVGSAWPFPDDDGAYDESEERFDTEDDPVDSAAHVSSPYHSGPKPHAPHSSGPAHGPSMLSPRTARLRGRGSPSRRPATASPSMSARAYSLLQRLTSPSIVNPAWDSSAPPPLPRPSTAFSQRDEQQQQQQPRGASPHRGGAPGSARSYAASVHSSPFGKPVPGAFRDPRTKHQSQQHHACRPSSSPHRRGAPASAHHRGRQHGSGSHDATANLAAFLHSPDSAAAVAAAASSSSSSAGRPRSSSSVRPPSAASPSRSALQSSVQDWSRLVNDLSGTAGDVQAVAAARAVDEAEKLLRTAKELARRAAVQSALDRARPVVRARTLAEEMALAEQAMAMESEAAVLRSERAALLAASVRAGKLKHRNEKKEEAKYALIVQQEMDALAARKDQVMKEAKERRAATVPRPATAKKKQPKQTPNKRADPAVSELLDPSHDAAHTDARPMPSHHHSSGHHTSPDKQPTAAVSEPATSGARSESVSPSHSTGPAKTHARTLSKSASVPADELSPARGAPAVPVSPPSSESKAEEPAASSGPMLVREEDDYEDDTTAEEDDAAFGPLNYPLRPQSSKRSRPASGRASQPAGAPMTEQSPQAALAAEAASRSQQPRTRPALQLSWDEPRLLVREPTPPMEPQPRLSELQVHAFWPGDNEEADDADAVAPPPAVTVAVAVVSPPVADDTPSVALADPASAAVTDLTLMPAVAELVAPQPALEQPLPASPPPRGRTDDPQLQPQPLSPSSAAAASAASLRSPSDSASAPYSAAVSESQVSQLSAAIETLSRVIAQQRPGSAGLAAALEGQPSVPMSPARSAPAVAQTSEHPVDSVTSRLDDRASPASPANLGSSHSRPESPKHAAREQQEPPQHASPSAQPTSPAASPAAVGSRSRRTTAAAADRSSCAASRPSSRPVSRPASRPASRPVSHPASPRAIVYPSSSSRSSLTSATRPAQSSPSASGLSPALHSAALPLAGAHDDFSGPAEDVVLVSSRSSRKSLSRGSRPSSAVSRPQSAAKSRSKSKSKSKARATATPADAAPQQEPDTQPRIADSEPQQQPPADEATDHQPEIAAVTAITQPRTPTARQYSPLPVESGAECEPAVELAPVAVPAAAVPAVAAPQCSAPAFAEPAAPADSPSASSSVAPVPAVVVPEFVAARTVAPLQSPFAPTAAPVMTHGRDPLASALPSHASARAHPAAKPAHKSAVQPRSRRAVRPSQPPASAAPAARPSSPSQSRRASVSASRGSRRGSQYAPAVAAAVSDDAHVVSPVKASRSSASVRRSSVSVQRPVSEKQRSARSQDRSRSRSRSRSARVDDADEFDHAYGDDDETRMQTQQQAALISPSLTVDAVAAVPSLSADVGAVDDAAAVSPSAVGPSDLNVAHLAALLHSAAAAEEAASAAPPMHSPAADPVVDSSDSTPAASSVPAAPPSDDDYTSDSSDAESSEQSDSSAASSRAPRAVPGANGRQSISSSVVLQ